MPSEAAASELRIRERDMGSSGGYILSLTTISSTNCGNTHTSVMTSVT